MGNGQCTCTCIYVGLSLGITLGLGAYSGWVEKLFILLLAGYLFLLSGMILLI